MADDDITKNKKVIPLLLPSCRDIKNYMDQIETPRKLWDFLQDDYKQIYDSCNFGNEPSFFDIIREVATRIRERHLALNLPRVPMGDDLVNYKNWCIDAQKIFEESTKSKTALASRKQTGESKELANKAIDDFLETLKPIDEIGYSNNKAKTNKPKTLSDRLMEYAEYFRTLPRNTTLQVLWERFYKKEYPCGPLEIRVANAGANIRQILRLGCFKRDKDEVLNAYNEGRKKSMEKGNTMLWQEMRMNLRARAILPYKCNHFKTFDEDCHLVADELEKEAQVLARTKPAETNRKDERSMLMITAKSSKENWEAIKGEYGISKKDFGKKINFVKDPFKRKVIFRDVEHAFVLASQDFPKPVIILSGGVIEELLRLYLDHKNIKMKSDDGFSDYIKACEDNGLLKRGVLRLTDSVRDFRNLVHLAKETEKRHTISKATAKGAVSSIFTIANDFQ